MTKIIAGTAGLITTIALVGVAAFAQFTTQVQANNVTFTTGTAALEFQYPYGSASWSTATSFDAGGPGTSLFNKFVPGTPQSGTFGVRNTGDVPLALSLRLTTAPVGWNDLKDEIELRIYRKSTPPAVGVGYRTLAQWNVSPSTPLDVTLGPVADPIEMTVEARLIVGSTATNKSVNTNWVLTGTQAP